MTLLTVTLTWDFTDALQSGESAFLQAIPTNPPWVNASGMTIVDGEPLTQDFTGGPGSLAGIIANDNAGLSPAAQGYEVSVRKADGTVLYDQTVILNHAAGASQDLSALTPAAPINPVSLELLAANNLSDVASASTALANLGGASSAALSAETTRAEAAEGALATGVAAAATAYQGPGTAYWNAELNGLACDGVTDDTAALSALLATVYANGGGTIVFPSLSLCTGQILIPNDGNSPPNQPPIRLTSAFGPDRFGTSNSRAGYPAGGLRLTYAGRSDTGCGTTAASAAVTDPAAVAADLGRFVTGPGIPDKTQVLAVTPGTGYTLSQPANATGTVTLAVFGGRIQSVGCGYLEIDHLELSSGTASSPAPFGWSTNTVLSLHDNAITGSTAKSGLTCNEDAWVFGGTLRAFAGGDTTQAFQGYGSTVERNFFNHIRRLLCMEDVSSCWVSHNTWWQVCGSNLTCVTTLTSALVSGTPYTSLSVAALPNPVVSGDVIQVGNAGNLGTAPVQQVTATAPAAAGSTTITCSFTATANFATGTQVTDYTTGLSAPFESAAVFGEGQANLPSVEFNRFEMDSNYTHATIFRYSVNGIIIGNEIQDANAVNVACHYFDVNSTYNLVIPRITPQIPLIDSAVAGKQTTLDPRQSQQTTLPQGVAMPGAGSVLTDGQLPPATDASGNTWRQLASAASWLFRYTPAGGSSQPVMRLISGGAASATWTTEAAITTLTITGQGTLALRSAVGSLITLGDTTRTQDVFTQNGNLVVTHLLAQGAAPAIAADSSSTGLAIAGQDTAHRAAFTTAAALPAGSSAITVTFGLSYATRAPAKTPRLALTPKNQASASAGAYITNDSATGYDIALASPPASATAMAFDVTVIAS